jgi:hypothetical protein
MRDVAGDKDEIERAFAGDLVGDVDVAALCVLNVRDFHGDSVRPSRRRCNVRKRWAVRAELRERHAAGETLPQLAERTGIPFGGIKGLLAYDKKRAAELANRQERQGTPF